MFTKEPSIVFTSPEGLKEWFKFKPYFDKILNSSQHFCVDDFDKLRSIHMAETDKYFLLDIMNYHNNVLLDSSNT